MSTTTSMEKTIYTFFETISHLEDQAGQQPNQSIYVYAVLNNNGNVNVYMTDLLNQLPLASRRIKFDNEETLISALNQAGVSELYKIEDISVEEFDKILTISGHKYLINNANMATDITQPVIYLYGGNIAKVALQLAYQSDILPYYMNDRHRRLRFKSALTKPLSIHNAQQLQNQHQESYFDIYERLYGHETIRTLRSKTDF